jgi:hypothetical protein
VSIAGYFGSGPADLQVKGRDLAKGITVGVTEVSSGRLPAEERVPSLHEKCYPSVGDYDPVLRAHCRLDQEG